MTSVLTWSKPPRIMSPEARASIRAAGAPPGVFAPNMSAADEMKWKAKLTGVRRKTGPQVEIRRNGMVVIVSLDGDHIVYKGRDEGGESNVRISMCAPQHMTSEEFREFQEAVAEAADRLRAWYENGA